MAKGAAQSALPTRPINRRLARGISRDQRQGERVQGLLRISGAIDRFTAFVGRWVSWLILASVLVSSVNAVIRKAFSMSSNAWLELQWYLFGAAFFLAAAYTLQRNEHIRIDIVSSLLPQRVRDWIDVFGHLVILLPFTGFMTWQLWFYFVAALRSGEMSASYGGLIIWPARLIILAGFAMLFVQGISEIIKRIAVIRGEIPDPHALTPHEIPVE
jgi:TRAP-type mannitol/chloroaromatic compound transport system permease small subunit